MIYCLIAAAVVFVIGWMYFTRDRAVRISNSERKELEKARFDKWLGGVH